MTDTLNDPADLFADDAHAEKHPEVYGRRERAIAPDAVSNGERNAVGNAARGKALRANRARFRIKRTGQGELFGYVSSGVA